MKDFIGVLLLTIIFLCQGVYLIARPQQYKDDVKGFGHVIGTFPAWSIRALGAFIIAVGLGVFYLFWTNGM